MEGPITDRQDGVSDYGSDFTPDEEEILNGLLRDTRDLDQDTDLLIKDIEENEGPRGAKLPRRLEHEHWIARHVSTLASKEIERKHITVQIDGDAGDIATKIESDESRGERQRSTSIEAPIDPAPESLDLRSPLERFRTKPKKTLSVTDLVSPSWCELQYWYVLTKHGRKKRTSAMRQGSAVHKKLEDEVHQTVAVDVRTSEDAWGLRIWNIVQGLTTLRATGMTRELEVWGVIDGLVVNGVIDELSYICPDRELEAAEEKAKRVKETLDPNQSAVTDFLGGKKPFEGNGADIRDSPRPSGKTPKIYLTDVKTRGVRSLPKASSFRPTLMQLMLYHRLLSDLATNKVDADLVFDRYGLNADAPFTDNFIAQIGSLNEGFYDTTSEAVFSQQSQDFPECNQDSMTTLLSHNSLRSLWGLMIDEFARTMPAGANSIGGVLKAEYRSQADGEILGAKTFLHDKKTIKNYLEEEMSWWKGERSAQGVCVEEAYKCGYCEFAEECSWRKNKIEEATGRMRARTKSLV